MTLMAKPDSNHDATPKLKLKKVDLALKKLNFAPTDDEKTKFILRNLFNVDVNYIEFSSELPIKLFTCFTHAH